MKRAFYYIVIIAIVALFAKKAVLPTGLEYSDGTRTGQLSKFSDSKGFVFKTAEGELVLGGLKKNSEGSAVANIFKFSASKKSVIDTLNANPGATMTLYYTEYLNVNMTEGSTSYLIDKVVVHRE